MAERRLTYEAVHTRALVIWRDKQRDFPPRVKRMEPDTLDMASGAWGLVFEQAARELGWKPGDEIAAALTGKP